MRPALLAGSAVAHALLNPGLFLLLLFARGDALLSPTGETNVTRLRVGAFAASCLLAYAAFTALAFVVLSLLGRAGGGLAFLDAWLGRWSWWRALIFAFMALLLGTWRSGMEGNIAGFIFFPPLLLCALIQLVLFARALWSTAA